MSNETDRELLELAAKAAGYEWRWNASPFATYFQIQHPTRWDIWNPLTDDGDALRLAVKLNLFFNPLFMHYVALERFATQETDDLVAHRRAIVRAAAEIGKAM